METTQEIKWARGTLGQQPAGYSDIYWCEAKNGPTVHLRKGDRLPCRFVISHCLTARIGTILQ
jgi:hypothetical protein